MSECEQRNLEPQPSVTTNFSRKVDQTSPAGAQPLAPPLPPPLCCWDSMGPAAIFRMLEGSTMLEGSPQPYGRMRAHVCDWLYP